MKENMYQHKSRSKVFLLLCVSLVAIIFIVGIIAGFVFKNGLFEDFYSYSSLYSRESFNWTLAITIWLSDIVPAVILYAVYSHLENQEVQINILNAMRESNNITAKDINRSTSVTSSNQSELSYERLSALSFDELKQIAKANEIEIPLTKTQLIGRMLARTPGSIKIPDRANSRGEIPEETGII